MVRALRPLGIAATLVFAAGPGLAEPPSEPDWLERPLLTGDWGGYRTRLEARGVEPPLPLLPLAFLLLAASMAIALLPICRSPIINSRWPRPIGIIASMTRMPVYRGS